MIPRLGLPWHALAAWNSSLLALNEPSRVFLWLAQLASSEGTKSSTYRSWEGKNILRVRAPLTPPHAAPQSPPAHPDPTPIPCTSCVVALLEAMPDNLQIFFFKRSWESRFVCKCSHFLRVGSKLKYMNPTWPVKHTHEADSAAKMSRGWFGSSTLSKITPFLKFPFS